MGPKSPSPRPRGCFPLPPGLLLAALLVAGCRAVETQAEYPQDLYHPDYVKRSKAVAEFARRRDESQLPEAFRLLLDEDAGIRLVAYMTIRDLSPGNEDYGYRPYLPRDVRFGCATRWQAWWKNGRPADGAPVGAAGEATAEAARG